MSSPDIHVLILEDNPQQAQILERFLKTVTSSVFVTKDPEEALKQIRIRPFQLCYIDCFLPKTNGMMVSREIRKYNPSVLICFITGIIQESTVRDFKHDWFLKKPLENQRIIEIFREASKKILGETSQKIDKPESEQQTAIAQIFSQVQGVLEEDITNVVSKKKDLKGFHAFYILSLYMAQKVTGCLKIINDKENFYIFLKNGQIYDLQTHEPQSDFFKNILLQSRILSEDEWSGLNESRIIESLAKHPKVGEKHLSVLRGLHFKEQFKKIAFNQNQFEFTFSKYESPVSRFTLSEKMWNGVVKENLSQSFLGNEWKSFFQHVSPLTVSWRDKSFQEEDKWSPLAENIKDKVVENMSVKDALDSFSEDKDEAIKYLGYLILCGFIQLKNNSSSQGEKLKVELVKKDSFALRFESLLSHLKGKTPEELFEFLGVKTNPETTKGDYAAVYKEFIYHNHEDRLPQVASSLAVKLNKEVHFMVRYAYEALTDNEKKMDHEKKIATKDSELKAKIEKTIEQALILYRNKKFDLAMKLCEAGIKQIDPKNKELRVQWVLAHITKKKEDKAKLSSEEQEKIKIYLKEAEDTTKANYNFVSGLFQMELGRLESARSFLERSLEINPDSSTGHKYLIFINSKIERLEKLNKKNIFKNFLQKNKKTS